MTDFIFPSDAARAENEDLNRACEYIEQILETEEKRKAVYRRRGQEVRELSASLMLAQSLLKRAVTITVGYRGIVPVLAYSYDQKLKEEMEEYRTLPPEKALETYAANRQIEELEDVAASLSGYSKRIVENKIRKLSLGTGE